MTKLNTMMIRYYEILATNTNNKTIITKISQIKLWLNLVCLHSLQQTSHNQNIQLIVELM